jgi:hypothetical protein
MIRSEHLGVKVNPTQVVLVPFKCTTFQYSCGVDDNSKDYDEQTRENGWLCRIVMLRPQYFRILSQHVRKESGDLISSIIYFSSPAARDAVPMPEQNDNRSCSFSNQLVKVGCDKIPFSCTAKSLLVEAFMGAFVVM